MKKINRIEVKLQSYINYLEKNGNDKLDDLNHIWTPSKRKFLSYINLNEEIFEGRETDYEMIEEKDNYKENNMLKNSRL